jgi:hypothetical protein
VQGYYLRHLDLPYNMLPLQPNFSLAEVNTTLDRLEQQRLWFIPIRANRPDTGARVLVNATTPEPNAVLVTSLAPR